MCAERGWSVHLVTVENPGIPVLPGLGRPLPLLPRLLPPTPGPPETVARNVSQSLEVSRRLSEAGYGEPILGPWAGLTRVITSSGDEWR